MKIDAYIPLYGNDFFQAMEGRTDSVIVGYMRCLWHYWHHTHCSGLPDDDEFLRLLCRCDLDKWRITKAVIFDNALHFILDGGRWHQKKARELHADAAQAYEERAERMRKAREKNHRVQTLGTDISGHNAPDIRSRLLGGGASGSDSDSDSGSTPEGGCKGGTVLEPLPPPIRPPAADPPEPAVPPEVYAKATTWTVAILAAYGERLETAGAPVVTKVRANCAELAASQKSEADFHDHCDWCQNSPSQFRPKDPVSATDISKWVRWRRMAADELAEQKHRKAMRR